MSEDKNNEPRSQVGGSTSVNASNNKKPSARRVTRSEIMELAEKNKVRDRQRSIDEKVKREPVIGMARIVVTGLAVVTALSAGLWAVGTAGGHEDKVRANSETINSLQAENEAVNDNVEHAPSAQTMKTSIARGHERAAGLMDIQNQMIDKAQFMDDATLADYARLVDAARGFIDRGSHTGGDFLPQGRWYQAYEVVTNERGAKVWKAIPRDRWSWHMVPSEDIRLDGQVPIIWEAQFTQGDLNGHLLMTVTGLYDPATDQFHDLQRMATPDGRDFMGATTTSTTGQEQYAADVRDEQNHDLPHDPAPSDEEMMRQAQKAQEEQAKQAQKDGHAPAPADNIPQPTINQ